MCVCVLSDDCEYIEGSVLCINVTCVYVSVICITVCT